MLRAGRWLDTPLNSRVAYPWFAIIALALVGVLAIIKVEPTVEAAVPQLTRAISLSGCSAPVGLQGLGGLLWGLTKEAGSCLYARNVPQSM